MVKWMITTSVAGLSQIMRVAPIPFICKGLATFRFKKERIFCADPNHPPDLFYLFTTTTTPLYIFL